MRWRVFTDQRQIIHLVFYFYHKEEYNISSCMHLSSLKLKIKILSLGNIKVQIKPTTFTTSGTGNTNVSNYGWKTAEAFIAVSSWCFLIL